LPLSAMSLLFHWQPQVLLRLLDQQLQLPTNAKKKKESKTKHNKALHLI